MGYPDPTNPTFEATTESYHRTLMECLRRMKQYKDKGEDPKKIGIMVASHNEDTVRFAIEKYVLQNIFYEFLKYTVYVWFKYIHTQLFSFNFQCLLIAWIIITYIIIHKYLDTWSNLFKKLIFLLYILS